MIQIIDRVTHCLVFQRGSKTLCANNAYPARVEMSVEHTGDPLIFRYYLNDQLHAQLIFDLTDDGELYCEVDPNVNLSLYVLIAMTETMKRYEDDRYYFEGGVESLSYLADRIFWTCQKYQIERKPEG